MARNRAFDYEEKLEKVRDLFWEKGYQATSMQDIVKTLQLNKSSIYNTYGNKQTLFLACLSDYAKMKTAQYKAAATHKDKAFAVLSHVVHDVMNQTIKDQKSCLIVRTIFELGNSDEAVSTLIKGNAWVLEGLFKDLLEKAQESKEIKQSIVPEVAAKYILSSFSGFYKYYILSGNKKEVKEMIDFMLAMMKE
ncbi:TetR/AcrR family transcriptional regulator [Myroides odoratus]|uniref:TetR/AcrR family transcriptional regulator n=1 Tax=Myroides odoratus TaxID=256 RepID=UPI0039B01F35